MTLGTSDDELEQTLETALDIAEGERVKYHLREALQLRIVDTDVPSQDSGEKQNC